MKSFLKYTRFPRFWSIILVISLGFLITLLGAISVRQLEQQTVEAHFVQVAEGDVFAIHTTLNWYLEPLQAFAAFYGASVAITRQEFTAFVKPFLAQRPGIEAIQWIPRIPAEHRLAYEVAVRTETAAGRNFADFTFTEYGQAEDGQPRLVLANPRAEYYPIYYQEPMRQDGAPLGFDLGSEPTYRRALTTARDQGQGVTIKPLVFAAKRNQHQFIVQVFYPVYAQGMAANTPQTRARSLAGFIAIVLRVHDVLDNTLRNMPPDDTALSIYEHFTAPAQSLLYHSLPLSSATLARAPSTPFAFYPQHVESALLVVKPLTTFGKQWQLVLQPTAAYMARNPLWYHWVVWACGLLGTGSVATYLYLILNRHREAEMMVRERTEQLRQANAQLQATLQELQFQKSLLESTSEAAQDGILVVSPERKWLFFNQRFVDMWQLPQEVVERRASAEGIPWIMNQVANPQRSRQNIEQLYAEPTARASDEITLKNGAVYERFSAPVQRADGFIYARVWYFRDISQRKRAEEALRQSEAHNRALVNAIPDLLFQVNKEGVFLEYHGSAGYTAMKAPEEFLGRNVDELFPPESAQRLKERIAHVLASGEAKVIEYEMPMLNGELRAWEQRMSVLNDAEVLLIIRDITARKRAEAALQTSQQHLQERQQHEKAVVEAELARVRNQLVANTRLATLGQVAATIAHELRNPLGAVRNAVYYIRRYLAKDQQDLLEFLQIIDVEVSTADRIITDLLEMSRAKEPGIQQLDLCAVAHEIWRQIKHQNTVNFHCVVAQEPFWVWADATQFRQILTNLLTNAVQAMPHGGDLSISGAYQGNDVVLTIQDNGPGVPLALREQIFEPLFTTKAKGTGLGLTLCRQIVERHGGRLNLVDSEQGARFELCLPYKPNADVA